MKPSSGGRGQGTGAGRPLGCMAGAGSGCQASVLCPVIADGGSSGSGESLSAAKTSLCCPFLVESHAADWDALAVGGPSSPPIPHGPGLDHRPPFPLDAPRRLRTGPIRPPRLPSLQNLPGAGQLVGWGGPRLAVTCCVFFFNSRNYLSAKKWWFSCGTGAVSQNASQGCVMSSDWAKV